MALVICKLNTDEPSLDLLEDTALSGGVFCFLGRKRPFKVAECLSPTRLCVYSISDQTSLTNHRSWERSQIHPTHLCGPPAFWQTPGPDWKICAQFGGQVWCDLGMIYKALGGVHMICAPLAKFSLGVSDSFKGKCIRWGQMGSLTGTRGVSSKSYETQKQPIFPPLYSKV